MVFQAILACKNLRFTCEQADTTSLRLKLASTASNLPEQTWDYAGLCCFSRQTPWEPESCTFREITCSEDAYGINVLAETDLFRIRDHFSFRHNMLQINREWTMLKDAEKIVLGTRIPLTCDLKEKITLPGVIYNDNPGAAPERLVPHLPSDPGDALVVEEHRLPIPGINREWQLPDGSFHSLTLFTLPTQTPAGETWSLGLTRRKDGAFDLLSLSGVVAFGKERDVLYGAQNRLDPMPGFGYLDLKKGETLRKTLALDLAACPAEGRGFTTLIDQGMKLYQPKENPVLTLDEVISLKTNAMDHRWEDTPNGSGFHWITATPEEGNIYHGKSGFLYGWVGQSLRLAWCALTLGLHGDDRWMKRGITVLDHFASAPEAVPGLKYHFHDPVTNEWSANEARYRDRINSRQTGESLAHLAACLQLLRAHGQTVKPEWEETLRRGADFLLDPAHRNKHGIYPLFFFADGTPADDLINGAGTACIEALISAAEYFDDPALQEGALAVLDRYYDVFLRTLEYPFSRATLDAACEDKESGLYFFLAAYRAYCRTGSEKHREYARLSAKWIATFVYFWSVPFRPGTLCADNGFDSVFWPGVSVQNMHLDVYFPAYEVYDFGVRTGDEDLRRIGQGVMSAWSHGIVRYPGDWNLVTPGEQSEQFFQTNYMQGPFAQTIWRGGTNVWNPVWIVALVLSAALSFKYHNQSQQEKQK